VGKIGARNSKTVVGIAANAKLWIQDMGYDQYTINIDQLHHHFKIIWYSYMCFFSHFDLIPQQW
jgi:hypothetical protein